ncbi:17-beta-hydroxysteroid dehydrogenase 14-like [Sphaerodactylus townsendi]|uniref:17-beta-hydroxysteroid dehydrogenase 14-like n=1 Tax=Sphaerodactylus townsendi TaxID=933632 RepID=UPI002027394D|nr:17-beta-hydroxysteroid dehydrogenase 14-like [Sphaerodactylus townsendi]
MAGQLRYPGKVVIVTGGTSGIGLVIVREFVRQGANVVFCSEPSQVEVGEAIQRELQNCGCPGDAYFQVCDVCNETDIKRLILVTVERYGCLDCLVNNAGDAYAEKIDDVTAQEFRRVLKLNTLSVLLASKYALPYLRETRGNIVNIGGIDGVFGMNNIVSHASSKGAVIAMTKTLAIDESKYGVRVNCISVGHIWTPMNERYINQFPDPEATLEDGKSYQLLGRLGTPEEVALAALYLAADGTFCTGFDLLLTGGAEVGFGIKNLADLKTGPRPSGNLQGSSSKQ